MSDQKTAPTSEELRSVWDPATWTRRQPSEAWQQDIDYFTNNRVEWDPIYMRAAGLRLIDALTTQAEQVAALRQKPEKDVDYWRAYAEGAQDTAMQALRAYSKLRKRREHTPEWRELARQLAAAEATLAEREQQVSSLSQQVAQVQQVAGDVIGFLRSIEWTTRDAEETASDLVTQLEALSLTAPPSGRPPEKTP
jgi:hypothetical protein